MSLLFSTLWCSALLYPFSWGESPPILLSIGGSHIIKTSALETMEIQKKGILRVKDEGDHLIFVGKKLGETPVLIGGQRYHFQVIHKKHHETFNQLQKWVKEKRGPRISLIHHRPVVTGRLLTLSDFKALASFTNAQSEFQLQAQVALPLKHEIKNSLQNRLNENHLPTGELVFNPNWRYHIGKGQELSHYKRLLSPFGIEVFKDSQLFKEKLLIKIQIYIAHVKKNFLRQWGVSWPDQISGQWGATSQGGWETGQPGQQTGIELALKALESKGEGQVLARPSLITESHKEASFHSGGEFPIRTSTQFSNSIQWKKFGLFLKVTPQANAKKNLHIKIDLEMSSLDKSQSNIDVPALQRSYIKTQINLERPAPIFLSGLQQFSQQSGRHGLPWLQQIPLFKPLFSTGQIHNNNYELIFVLVPSFYE